MNKKLKAKTKRSSSLRIGKSGKRSGSAKQPSLTNSERLIRFVGAFDSIELQSQYRALMGLARPVDEIMASNAPIMQALVRRVTQAAKAHSRANSCPIGLQIVRVAVTPGSEANIDVVAARKCVQLYKRTAPDLIAAVRLCPIPSLSDARGFDIATELAVIFFGDGLGSPFRRSVRRSRVYCETRQSPIRWVDVDDVSALRSAGRELLMPPYTALPPGSTFDDPPEPPEWAEANHQRLRNLVILMCRSQFPAKRMVHATGAGKHVIASAMSAAELALKRECKAAAAILHRDAIAHFWFSELRRLGFDDIAVPFVRMR